MPHCSKNLGIVMLCEYVVLFVCLLVTSHAVRQVKFVVWQHSCFVAGDSGKCRVRTR